MDNLIETKDFPICPICFENIGSINNCITPCGHTFCLICMLKCIKKNNSCPCCRAIIIEDTPDDNSEYDDYNEEDYEREDNERDDEIEDYADDEREDDDTDDTPDDYNTEIEPYEEPYEDTYLVSLDKIAEVLKSRGYTLLDMLYCFNYKNLNCRLDISSIPPWTVPYKYKQVHDIIYELDNELLNEELLRESNEKKLMFENDKPPITHICEYASLDKIADKLNNNGYTHLDVLHCIKCRIFSGRLKYSSPPSHNKTSLEFYELIDELDNELYNERNETTIMIENDSNIINLV